MSLILDENESFSMQAYTEEEKIKKEDLLKNQRESVKKRVYYLKNREKIVQYQRIYQEKNHEKCLKRAKKYREKHKNQRREYYLAHKMEDNERSRLYRIFKKTNLKLSKTRNAPSCRNIEDIEYEQYLLSEYLRILPKPQGMKGCHLSVEHKKKMSASLKGRKFSEAHKLKISKALKGKVNIGKIPWNKGKHLSEDERRTISNIHKGKHYSRNTEFKLGRQWSNEILTKIGASLKGRKFSDEHKQKIRESRLKQVLPQKDTAIEVKTQNELKRRGVAFEKHVSMYKTCQPDIVIPEKKLVIFCDGDYWHNLPKMKNKDQKHNTVLAENGWKVYRFWEHEINASVSACIDKILELEICMC